MAAGPWMTIREAWHRALYEPGAFYTTHQPAHHFRTSVHASPLFAEALIRLIRHWDLTGVLDLGSGGGELLHDLHEAAPDLALAGADLRGRPEGLPSAVDWHRLGHGGDVVDLVSSAPARTLVLANEVLDNIPCEIVELDQADQVRVVETRLDTGEWRLGPPASDADVAWLDRWWSLGDVRRLAEIGHPRDALWQEVCGGLGDGVCVAIDYGHVESGRPHATTLTSYRVGRERPVCFDGAHDVTAHVAVDAVAAAVGGELSTQREMLRALGIRGTRPDVALASSAPSAYLRSLAKASEAAELTASPGLGDFWWITWPKRQDQPMFDGVSSAD